MIDRDSFFGQVRAHPFGGAMRQGQVDGCNAIFDAQEIAALHAGFLRGLA